MMRDGEVSLRSVDKDPRHFNELGLSADPTEKNIEIIAMRILQTTAVKEVLRVIS